MNPERRVEGGVMRTKRTEYKHVRLWPDGTPTVSGTRLKVKHIAEVYNGGQKPEEIQASYTSHTLGEIYSALAYYLDHKEAMDHQIEQDKREVARLWAEIQAWQGPSLTREQLLERRGKLDRVS